MTHGILTSGLSPVLHDWGGLLGESACGRHHGKLTCIAPDAHLAGSPIPQGTEPARPEDGSSQIHGGAQHKDKAAPSWSDWHVSLINEVIFGSISLS